MISNSVVVSFACCCLIGFYQVTDSDGPTNAAPFTFDIRSGNVDNAFRIDQNGSLRTAKRFNHRVQESYGLQIRVFDNGSPPLYSDTWVFVKVIEESKYPPIITPLEVGINSFLDEFAGGIIGRVHVTDQDPYDTLVFGLASLPKSSQSSSLSSGTSVLFEIDAEDGTIIAQPGLDVGTYSVNVSVSDGKFTTYSAVRVNVVLISDDALHNAVILTIRDMSAEDFVLSYRKNLLKAVRNIMNVRTKDVFIVSVQPQTAKAGNRTRDARETHSLSSKRMASLNSQEPLWRASDAARSTKPGLDILFAVQNPTGGFYPPAHVRNQLMNNAAEMETTLGHRISGFVQVIAFSSIASNCAIWPFCVSPLLGL